MCRMLQVVCNESTVAKSEHYNLQLHSTLKLDLVLMHCFLERSC